MKTAVIGGGIAGLTAALFLERSGHEVTLMERRSALGGRAETKHRQGYAFNLGPHALYQGGRAEAVLHELGIALSGGDPLKHRADRIAWRDGVPHLLPTGPLSMLRTDLLSFGDKVAFGRLSTRIPSLNAAAWRGRTVSAWIDALSPRPAVRALLHALVRLTSYVDMPEDMDAELAIEQLAAALRGGVSYLHGGWGALIEAMRDAARAVRFVGGCKVERIEAGDDSVCVHAGGEMQRYDAVVVATGAKVAGALLGRRFAVTPVRAASLTVALDSEQPRARSPLGPCTFALGIDRGLYYSAHHDAARLAPEGGQLVHALRYLHPEGGPQDAGALRAELERLMDAMQPGWRDHLVHAAYQPNLTVCWDVARASRGGLPGRTPVATDCARIALAGDWVGDEGHLADAAFASGKRAADQLSTQLRRAA